MIKGIKWVFFDMGSTLIDESCAYEHLFKDISIFANITYQQVYDTALEFYKQNKEGYKEVIRKLNIIKPKWHTEDEFLYNDTIKCLEQLKKKYKIGIIANQPLGSSHRLEKYGILKYIDLVIASTEEGVSKPDKRIFEIALMRSNCKPREAVMVGDRIDNDIIPAKMLGMNTIWVKQGFGQYWIITEEKEKADYVVSNIFEVCKYL